MKSELQWGGRFAALPDAALLRFGSSLAEDLVLAPFDIECSRAHVVALRGGGIIPVDVAECLDRTLARIAEEVADGTFNDWAQDTDCEDVHGAIDRRVRDIAGHDIGERLHSGRSRNDQVATTLLLYVRARARAALQETVHITHTLLAQAEDALAAETILAATTHWQPAQPILLAFWLASGAEMFVRAARRLVRVIVDAERFCPLGSGAVSGSTLPLARELSSEYLGFAAPSRIAMDAIGNRDVACDLLYALARSLVDASRMSEEIVLWATPAFGYVRLDDAASTGSSLMPQKRNPDPFELVRAHAAGAIARVQAALGTMSGLALSYHRDLQETKAHVLSGTERGLGALTAFRQALPYVSFQADAMNARAADGYTVVTDWADALIASGVSARVAHEAVGAQVGIAEREQRALTAIDLEAVAQRAGYPCVSAPLDARASVFAKKTLGSTAPEHVAKALASLRAELALVEDDCCA